METSKSEVNMPRRSGGDSSAVYSGPTTKPQPTPNPIRMRPASRPEKPYESTTVSVPPTKRAFARQIAALRPKRSAKLPASSAPNAETRLRDPTTTSACQALRDRSFVMNTIAPLTMPMS